MAAFRDLASYTAEHFAHEEKFMQSIHYPQFSSHKKIHEKLLIRLENTDRKLKTGH
jgi:hemerythrin-like metal-binding protein